MVKERCVQCNRWSSEVVFFAQPLCGLDHVIYLKACFGPYVEKYDLRHSMGSSYRSMTKQT